MIFVAVKPDGKPLGAYASMKDAQDAIADIEPDIVWQGQYQIHPIASPKDAEKARLKLIWNLKVEKFEGGQLVETIEREGVD